MTMKRALFSLLPAVCVLLSSIVGCGRPASDTVRRPADHYTVPLEKVRGGDPFVLADASDSTYYLYTTGGGGKVRARASKDLAYWTEPFVVMEFDSLHWAGNRAASWAAEVHEYKGKYYLFTTSHNDQVIEHIEGRYDIPRRATQIYVADSPRGPFRDFTGNRQHTPMEWASLDGTLWVEEGVPYMVFCHEWLQTVDGTMELVRLPDDLGVPTERPVTLFHASDAPWSREMLSIGEKTYGLDLGGNVTDGPFVFRTQTGRLGMLWSSWGSQRYAMGVAYSESGKIAGPWVQEDEAIYKTNGGHGMLFRTFDGRLMMSLHWEDPADERPFRKPMFIEMDDSGDRLTVKENPTDKEE